MKKKNCFITLDKIVRKLAGEYTFHFVVSSVSFLFAFFSSHLNKIYTAVSLFTSLALIDDTIRSC